MNMKRAGIILITTIVLCLFATTVLAGEVAFVDLDKALQLTSKGKETQKKLAAMKDDFELKVRQREMDLRKQQEELETQKNVLSEDAFKNKMQEFQKGVMDYQQQAMEMQQKFDEYRVKQIRSFVKDMESVTQQIAKSAGYKIVILKVEDVVTTSSLVVYGDPGVDLTDLVVKKLNESSAPAK
jgi:Skp family chaperone for outer membrane proteins